MEQEGAGKEALMAHLGRGRARKGMFEGDMEDGELEIGQIAGAVDVVKPAAGIVSEIMSEYAMLKADIGAKGGRC